METKTFCLVGVCFEMPETLEDPDKRNVSEWIVRRLSGITNINEAHFCFLIGLKRVDQILPSIVELSQNYKFSSGGEKKVLKCAAKTFILMSDDVIVRIENV